MATQTYEQLIAGANKIKENELPESNTHDLVGEQLLQMTNKMQEESTKTDNSIMEYNVSKFYPTSGLDGTNKYTLETAIALVPEKYRSIGIKCSFVNEDDNGECWEYVGNIWEKKSFIQTGAQTDKKLNSENISKKLVYKNDNITADTTLFIPISLQVGVKYNFEFLSEAGGLSVQTTRTKSTSDVIETISNSLLGGNNIDFIPTEESSFIRIQANSGVIKGTMAITNLYNNISLNNQIEQRKQEIINRASAYVTGVYNSFNFPSNTSFEQEVPLQKDKRYDFDVNIIRNTNNIQVQLQIEYIDNTSIYSGRYSTSFIYSASLTKEVKLLKLILIGPTATSTEDEVELEYYCIESNNYPRYLTKRLESLVPEMVEQKILPYNQLLRIPSTKKLINSDIAIKDRMQAAMQVSKSFTPCIDYRGQICFENFTDYENFDTSSAILFAEQITLTGLDYDSKIRSWLSLDEKNFLNYTTSQNMWGYVNGDIDNFANIWCHGSNDNNLHIITVGFNHVAKGKIKSLFWSLDGGRSYEPAVNNYRGHFAVSSSDINNANSVEIDGETFTVISAADVQAALKGNYDTYEDSVKLIEAAKNYLSDKIVKSNNQQDALRFLADKLISKGYYVRLNNEELVVYNKVTGTAGNVVSSIKIGGVAKTFANAEDLTLSEAAIKSGIFYNTNINYKDTESEILCSDIVNVDTILCINEEWYLFSHYYNGSVFANLCLKISDITNIESSDYRYTVISNNADNVWCEPCATYDRLSNNVYIGMRSQNIQPIRMYYSKDLCDTFIKYDIPNTDFKVTQGNAYIFRVNNPTLLYRGVLNTEYDRPANISNTYTILACCVFSRYVGIIYTSTAVVPNNNWDGNIENLQWSEWKPLKHINDDCAPNSGGFENNNFYYSDAGIASIGSICYSRRYRGLIIGYQGVKIIEKKWSYTISTCKEIC